MEDQIYVLLSEILNMILTIFAPSLSFNVEGDKVLASLT